MGLVVPGALHSSPCSTTTRKCRSRHREASSTLCFVPMPPVPEVASQQQNDSGSSSPSPRSSASSSGRQIPAVSPAEIPAVINSCCNATSESSGGKGFLGQKRELLSSLLSALQPHHSFPLLPSQAQGWAVSGEKGCSEDFCPPAAPAIRGIGIASSLNFPCIWSP